jgi:protein-L-isoaspartate(D-aspartate) O-methyltransferase
LNYFDQQKKELLKILSAQGIKDDRVLNAISKVKREMFVSPEFKRFAYDNNALPISNNQTISQPFTVAFMTELLEVKEGDKILEIGTGSGYQAAVLREMGAKVYSVERIEQLYMAAMKTLHENNYDVQLKCSDGTKGWPEYSPYDGIIVTAGSPDLPPSLLKQLKTGGRLVIPVGGKDLQEIWKAIKIHDEKGKEHADIYKYKNFKFVPLIGKEGW